MKESSRLLSIVQYALQDAIYNGNEYEGEIELDYFRLSMEERNELDVEPGNIKLKVKLSLRFDSSKDMGLSMEEILSAEEEENEDDNRSTDTDKISH